MLNLNTNWPSEFINTLKQWWPVIKSNLLEIQSVLNNHIIGTADKHNAEAINYSGNMFGDNVKSTLDNHIGAVEGSRHNAQDIDYYGNATGNTAKDALDNIHTEIQNLSFTGAEHDPLVTSSLIDEEGENFGQDGTGTYLDGRLRKWEQKQLAHFSDIAQNSYRIVQPNDGKYNSWPLITRAQNGDILVIYSKGSQHINGDPTRAVVYKRSTDFGMTWSDEAEILNDTYDDGVFSVGTTSAGTIIIIIRRVISDTTNYDQVVLRSTDNGLSWSAPATIPVLPVSTISVSPIIEVEGHGLMASFNDRPYSCELIWSTDDGVTWENRQTITIPADPNDAPLECRFVYIGSGKLFGIGRTNVEGAGLFQLQSEDYGATWTILRTNITDHYMTPTALMFQNDEVDIVYYHRATGALRQRHASITDIWGKSLFWTDSKVISYGSLKAADAGYPHAINLINDTCLCVYYSGNGNDNGTGGSTGIYGVLYSFKNNLSFKTPAATTANITYYVDVANGLDTNDGLTSNTAFKTITMAFNSVPVLVNHTVTINVAAGDYSGEGNLTLFGATGKGTINVLGDTANTTSYIISKIAISRCTIPVVVRGFISTITGSSGFTAVHSINVTFNYCSIIVPANTQDGVNAINSIITVSNCILSDHNNGIRAINSTIYSENNSGTGNTVGLLAEHAGTIGKNGTQPAGSTAEMYNTGGIIR